MRPPFAVLDFVRHEWPVGAPAPTLRFDDPVAVVQAHQLAEVPAALDRVDGEVAAGRHAVGFVAYEAAPAFDPALAVHAEARRPTSGESLSQTLPLVWFGIFDAPTERPSQLGIAAAAAPAHWRERSSATRFAEAVQAIRDAIQRGDVYQVNHTVRLDVDFDGPTDALYRRLLLAQGPGYGAHIHTGQFEILSASPELFFTRRGERIVTRPMKGTARRGRWLAEDDESAARLAASPKERAENVMIVDLIRNDLGRIAVTGSVTPTRVFEIERRPTVLQMTSTIEAALREGTSTRDIFAALFPCGSVTGAPKVAATQMIASLEDSPRGVYCGAIGHIAPGGDATFSVAIRTLTVEWGADARVRRAEYGVGSGITWDSANAAEHDEVIAKAAILNADLPQFELIETLRLPGGTYARLARHLTRVEESAAYFGFPAADLRRAAERALTAHAAAGGASAPARVRETAPDSVAERVRVAISPTGDARVTSTPLAAPVTDPVVVALASSPVRRQNRFLFHKTTHRGVYDRHRAEHPDAFDVLLWNEEGELTEFTIGNVVVELDGTRWTPPRDCGLLAGTFRAELLEAGTVRERVLTRADLERATGVWLVNSVREWVPCVVRTG